MTEQPRRRPTAEELYERGSREQPVERDGYPLIKDRNHPRWPLQQAGWPGLTPEEARALCESSTTKEGE